MFWLQEAGLSFWDVICQNSKLTGGTTSLVLEPRGLYYRWEKFKAYYRLHLMLIEGSETGECLMLTHRREYLQPVQVGNSKPVELRIENLTLDLSGARALVCRTKNYGVPTG